MVEIQRKLLRGAGTAAAVGEKTVGVGGGGEEKAPAGASTAVAVREYR